MICPTNTFVILKAVTHSQPCLAKEGVVRDLLRRHLSLENQKIKSVVP